MSGHKQPAVVKQTREVASLVYPVFGVVVIHWLPCVLTGPFYTVGDPAGHKIRWLKGEKFCLWKLENRLQTASVFLPLSQSLVEAQTEVTQGTAHALTLQRLLSPASWLRPRGQPGHSATQTGIWLITQTWRHATQGRAAQLWFMDCYWQGCSLHGAPFPYWHGDTTRLDLQSR